VDTLYQSGQMIEEYRIESNLARGKMSEVYLARDTFLDRPVVIKVIDPNLSHQPGFKEKFIREAKIQARLDNPHIVSLFRLLRKSHHLILVMQYIKGTDLNRVIQEALVRKKNDRLEGALSYPRAIHICFQVLEGIGFMHKYGILHGDIKPANILIDQQGRARITDFGLSTKISTNQKAQISQPSKGGTLAFLSPEEFLGATVDIRSDIYSLGATFYYMLTGKLPAGDIKSTTDLMEFHLEGSLEITKEVLETIKGIPERASQALLKSLDPNQDKRYQSCFEFMLALKEETPQELYSEIIRSGFVAKEAISYRERHYLDKLAEQKGLTVKKADKLEQNIRKELGLHPLDFINEFQQAVRQTSEGSELEKIKGIYGKEGRLTNDEMSSVHYTSNIESRNTKS